MSSIASVASVHIRHMREFHPFQRISIFAHTFANPLDFWPELAETKIAT